MALSYACRASKFHQHDYFVSNILSLHFHLLCMGNRDSKQIATTIYTTVAGI